MTDPIPQKGDINDSCFRIWNNALLASGKRLNVTINGVNAQRVRAYDVEKGWVIWQRLVDGRTVLKAGVIEEECVQGEIVVTIVDRTMAARSSRVTN